MKNQAIILWNPDTPAQITGTEEFQSVTEVKDFTSMAELTQYYPPIDLYNVRQHYPNCLLVGPCAPAIRPYLLLEKRVWRRDWAVSFLSAQPKR